MQDKPFLSVVIPSYNETINIKRGVLAEVLGYLQKQPYSWELLLSDDGSTDGTLALLQKFASEDKRIIVVSNHHAGKGPTVQSGMLAAQGQWRLFTDFDQSTPLKEIEKMWPFTKKGFEVIIGSREISGAVRDQEPWCRHIMGRGFNWLVQMLTIPEILDTQCGFKLFSEKSATILFNGLIVYGRNSTTKDAFTGAFDVEALFLAQKQNIKIKEVPISWHHHQTNRVSPLRDSIRMLFDIVRIRLTDLSGKYQF